MGWWGGIVIARLVSGFLFGGFFTCMHMMDLVWVYGTAKTRLEDDGIGFLNYDRIHYNTTFFDANSWRVMAWYILLGYRAIGNLGWTQWSNPGRRSIKRRQVPHTGARVLCNRGHIEYRPPARAPAPRDYGLAVGSLATCILPSPQTTAVEATRATRVGARPKLRSL